MLMMSMRRRYSNLRADPLTWWRSATKSRQHYVKDGTSTYHYVISLAVPSSLLDPQT